MVEIELDGTCASEEGASQYAAYREAFWELQKSEVELKRLSECDEIEVSARGVGNFSSHSCNHCLWAFEGLARGQMLEAPGWQVFSRPFSVEEVDTGETVQTSSNWSTADVCCDDRGCQGGGKWALLEQQWAENGSRALRGGHSGGRLSTLLLLIAPSLQGEHEPARFS